MAFAVMLNRYNESSFNEVTVLLSFIRALLNEVEKELTRQVQLVYITILLTDAHTL